MRIKILHVERELLPSRGLTQSQVPEAENTYGIVSLDAQCECGEIWIDEARARFVQTTNRRSPDIVPEMRLDRQNPWIRCPQGSVGGSLSSARG